MTERKVAVPLRIKPISMMQVTAWLRVFDLCIVAIASLALGWPFRAPNIENFCYPQIVMSIIGTLSAALMFELFRVYDSQTLVHLRLQLGKVILALGIALFLIFSDDIVLPQQDSQFHIDWAMSWFVLAALGLTALHVSFILWLQHITVQGRLARRTVVVGAGELGQRLISHLSDAPDPQIRVVGLIDDRRSRIPQNVRDVPVLGTIDTLIELIRQNGVDEVILALPWTAERRVHQLVYQLAVTPVRISLCADLAGFQFSYRGFVNVGGIPILHLFDRPISGASHLVKSIEDWAFGLLFLAVSAPVLLLIAAAIKLETPGQIFFKQKRLGFNDNIIEVWKFRTMHQNQTDIDGATLVSRSDPRVTRVGAILRRTSLDELPQLINVLKGNMSIVGPRPHPLKAKAGGELYWDAVASYSARHRVKPGITGWAQINGWRGETDSVQKLARRVEYDMEYINNWSIWLDLKIIVMTIFIVLSGRNAY